MGLHIKGDFESEIGQLKELYVRLENFTYRKADNILFVPLGLYIDESKSRSVIKKLIDYTQSKEGVEVEIPSTIKIPVVRTVETIEDIIEYEMVSEEVPYVSFDEEGEEITRYRTVKKQQEKKVGEKIITEEVADPSILQQDIFTTIYKHIEEELIKILPSAKITHV